MLEKCRFYASGRRESFTPNTDTHTHPCNPCECKNNANTKPSGGRKMWRKSGSGVIFPDYFISLNVLLLGPGSDGCTITTQRRGAYESGLQLAHHIPPFLWVVFLHSFAKQTPQGRCILGRFLPNRSDKADKKTERDKTTQQH